MFKHEMKQVAIVKGCIGEFISNLISNPEDEVHLSGGSLLPHSVNGAKDFDISIVTDLSLSEAVNYYEEMLCETYSPHEITDVETFPSYAGGCIPADPILGIIKFRKDGKDFDIIILSDVMYKDPAVTDFNCYMQKLYPLSIQCVAYNFKTECYAQLHKHGSIIINKHNLQPRVVERYKKYYPNTSFIEDQNYNGQYSYKSHRED